MSKYEADEKPYKLEKEYMTYEEAKEIVGDDLAYDEYRNMRQLAIDVYNVAKLAILEKHRKVL